MKKFILCIACLAMFFSTTGQVKTNFNNMTPREVRQFLLNQEDSEPVKLMIKKHNASRVSAYVFFATSLVMVIASDNSSNPDVDGKNTILLSTGAGIGFAIAGICGIVASERIKKAKNMYLNSANNSLGTLPSQIRNESLIIDSVFK